MKDVYRGSYLNIASLNAEGAIIGGRNLSTRKYVPPDLRGWSPDDLWLLQECIEDAELAEGLPSES